MSSITITREDIGGLFRTRGGDTVRGVYIHLVENFGGFTTLDQ